jgi:ATP-dependent DNA helicase RecG
LEKLGEKLGEKLNKNQQYIIEMISKNPYTTINELSRKIEISTTAIENNKKKLREKGLLKRIGSDKGGYWQIITKEEIMSKIDFKSKDIHSFVLVK